MYSRIVLLGAIVDVIEVAVGVCISFAFGSSLLPKRG